MGNDERITPELVEKARKVKSVEELKQLAKKEGFNVSDEKLNEIANKLGIVKDGKINEENLEKVSGGKGIGCGCRYF